MIHRPKKDGYANTSNTVCTRFIRRESHNTVNKSLSLTNSLSVTSFVNVVYGCPLPFSLPVWVYFKGLVSFFLVDYVTQTKLILPEVVLTITLLGLLSANNFNENKNSCVIF